MRCRRSATPTCARKCGRMPAGLSRWAPGWWPEHKPAGQHTPSLEKQGTLRSDAGGCTGLSAAMVAQPAIRRITTCTCPHTPADLTTHRVQPHSVQVPRYWTSPTSLAFNFTSGFKDFEAGILKLQWGLGTAPGSTDVLPLSDYSPAGQPLPVSMKLVDSNGNPALVALYQVVCVDSVSCVEAYQDADCILQRAHELRDERDAFWGSSRQECTRRHTLTTTWLALMKP